MEYIIIKSNRKTLALEIKKDGLVVRAPIRATDKDINEFVTRHKKWIENHLLKVREREKALDGIEPL